jgi:hypothetical protein
MTATKPSQAGEGTLKASFQAEKVIEVNLRLAYTHEHHLVFLFLTWFLTENSPGTRCTCSMNEISQTIKESGKA